MKQVIILSCILLLIVGCNPAKRLMKICKDCPRKDSISYVEKLKIDTFTMVTPPDTMIIEFPVDLPEFDILMEENSKQKITISILEGKLRVIAICKEDSLKQIISTLETQLSNQTSIEVPGPVEYIKFIPKWAKICIWGFFILLIVIGVRVYIWVRLKWFKK